MPNHCANQMTLTGDPKELARFKEMAANDTNDFDIQQFIPAPQDVQDAPGEQWYNWSMENGGTKAGSYEPDPLEEKNGKLTYRYFTAWGPLSDDVIERVSALFPDLSFEVKYAEQGMGFWGLATFRDGATIDHASDDMEYDQDTKLHSTENEPLEDDLQDLAANSG